MHERQSLEEQEKATPKLVTIIRRAERALTQDSKPYRLAVTALIINDTKKTGETRTHIIVCDTPAEAVDRIRSAYPKHRVLIQNIRSIKPPPGSTPKTTTKHGARK